MSISDTLAKLRKARFLRTDDPPGKTQPAEDGAWYTNSYPFYSPNSNAGAASDIARLDAILERLPDPATDYSDTDHISIHKMLGAAQRSVDLAATHAVDEAASATHQR